IAVAPRCLRGRGRGRGGAALAPAPGYLQRRDPGARGAMSGGQQADDGQGRDRRARWPSALARFVPRLTRPALRGFAKAEAALLLDWEVIVGPEVAAYTQPL